MTGARQARSFDAIVRVVLEILESEGYDAVQPRVVAERAHVSLRTIYKFAPTREDLIVTALCQWMQVNCYSGLADPPYHAPFFEGMMWVHRKLFEPWERHPRMLAAYYRAMTGPSGDRLDVQGMAIVEPVAGAFFAKVDPTYAKDLGLVMSNMICGVIQRAAVGGLPVTDILPVIERTLSMLTTDNKALADPGVGERPRKRPRRKA
jgi:TetR/AcrR family transcriptional regulator, cholesterol catabolism regulator